MQHIRKKKKITLSNRREISPKIIAQKIIITREKLAVPLQALQGQREFRSMKCEYYMAV